MTKYEVYECDRCGKEMRISPNSKPHQVKLIEDIDLDLCEDCYSSLHYWIKHYKEFDKLSDEICAKATGDDENG